MRPDDTNINSAVSSSEKEIYFYYQKKLSQLSTIKKEISKQNEIHLVSLTDVLINKSEVEHLDKYCKSITILYLPLWRRLLNLTRAFFNNKPFQVNYFYTYYFQNKINKLIEEIKPDHIFCQLIRTALYMKDQHHIPSTLDYMDALSKGIERRIPIAPFWMKPILNVEFKTDGGSCCCCCCCCCCCFINILVFLLLL